MQTDELRAWLRLTLTPGVGNESARKLLAAFGLPQAIFEQTLTALKNLVSEAQARAVQAEPPELPALLAATRAWLDGNSAAHILTLGDADYPASLLTILDPPLMLYMLAADKDTALNAIKNEASNLAMVGSRNPSPQGAATARQFAKDLSAAGLNIVSGMALGIDGAAHEGALADAAVAGRTIAVVGTGLDRVYPKQHRDLAHRIAQSGAIVSEFPLGTPPLAANFPKRNRIISGLSRATLVVEAALQSGSLITARSALEQGRDVLAIPGSIHSPQSRGCHALIKQGAKLVETAQDVLEEMPGHTTKNVANNIDNSPANGLFGLDGAETSADSALLSALGYAPTGLDALVARTGMDTASLQAQLLELELDGLVARLPGGLFQRQAQA
jgi:DNA processing protein